jgi:hypothetical protein
MFSHHEFHSVHLGHEGHRYDMLLATYLIRGRVTPGDLVPCGISHDHLGKGESASFYLFF